LSLKPLRPLLNTHSFSTELSCEYDSSPDFEGTVEYSLEAINLKKQRKGARKGREGGRK
jgi:hypothetical protein